MCAKRTSERVASRPTWPKSDASPASCRSRQQFRQPDQIGRRACKHEQPVHLLEAAQFDFAHPRDRFQPAKRRFDARPGLLTHRVARMPRRATVNSVPAGPLKVLGDVLRGIVRRDSAESYEEFLTHLSKASGIETPTRADLARIDRKRKKKGSNDDWTHPHDPDAKITKMKDGRTHLAHKAEHAVDLETGAIVGVTVQGADMGDTTTIRETLPEAAEQLGGESLSPEAAGALPRTPSQASPRR